MVLAVAAFCAASSLPSAPGGGGVYFEQTTVTLASGRPAGPGVISRVWFAGKKMRLEAGGAASGPALILRLDMGKAYRLDPSERTAVEVDVERLRARSQMDLAMAGDLMGAEEGTARTAALQTPRTIAGYTCRGYRITAGSAVMSLYVSRDVPVGVEAFADFLEWSGANTALAGMIDEIRRLPGFPLETRSRVIVLGKVHETVSTVTNVRVGPQPAALFEPPPGYHVVADEP